MSTAFFELTDIMDHETYLPLLKAEVDAAYGKNQEQLLNEIGRRLMLL